MQKKLLYNQAISMATDAINIVLIYVLTDVLLKMQERVGNARLPVILVVFSSFASHV
jgi:hypothetical protein